MLKQHAVKKSRYTEKQIAYALKQAEVGTPVAEVIRRMRGSEQTLYRWKKLYGRLGVGELRRPKQLEDKHILQDVLSKKVLGLLGSAKSFGMST